jgi:quercetin dioxygenase-like cupin family protein
MHHVRRESLPHAGASYRFVGADQGQVAMSAFLVAMPPGHGPGPHRHPYDEIQFVTQGTGRWTVDGVEVAGGAGDIFVIKAGEVHHFLATGSVPLEMTAVHLSPTFIQENLG